MSDPVILSPKRISKVYKQQFDFIADLAVSETISSATVTVTVYSGTDASPSSLKSGSATISGTSVYQTFTGGTAGVLYGIVVAATTSTSQVLTRVALLAIIPDVP